MKNAVIAALALILCLAFAAAPAAAAKIEVPDVILKGAQAFAKEGPEAGFKAWFAGSPLQVGVNVKALAEQTKALVANYGHCIGFGVIKVVPFTPRSSRVYFEMDFQGGPLFLSMLTYNNGSRWIVTGKFDLGREPEAVMPEGASK